MRIFLEMIPPTSTAQMHKVRVVNGKPQFYDPPEVRESKDAIMIRLAKHRPPAPLTGAVELKVMWLFPATKTHRNGEWRITKPDTDNLEKMLKDCMTATGYWNDDAQVCVEHVEKRWADHCGIYIEVRELGGETDG